MTCRFSGNCPAHQVLNCAGEMSSPSTTDSPGPILTSFVITYASASEKELSSKRKPWRLTGKFPRLLNSHQSLCPEPDDWVELTSVIRRFGFAVMVSVADAFVPPAELVITTEYVPATLPSGIPTNNSGLVWPIR